MLGSFAVLVAGLCAGLVAYYGGLPGGVLARQAGPDELAYVPPSAVVVAYADIQSVMTSELRRRLKDVMPADQEKGQEELKSKTGIDLEKDIDHVVACMVPREAEETSGDSGFVAFRGRFDEGRLEALAREHGAEVGEYKGKRLISIAEPDKDIDSEGHGAPRSMVLAFVEPGVAMFGDRRAVTMAIDARTSGLDVRSNADLMRHVRDIEGQANAWAVGRFDVLASRANLPEGVSGQIPAIRWFSAAGRVNGGVAGIVRAEARDEEAAKNLRDVANGFLALAKLQAGSRPEFQTAIQSLTLSGTGKTVEISFNVPVELLDALKAARELKDTH
jgi:hypothetical protein